MTKLKVEVRGLEKLRRKFNQMDIDKALRPAMQKAVTFQEREVAMRTPVDTGRARSSIGSKVEGIGSDVVGTVASGVGGKQVFYIPFLELGTRFMAGRFMFRGALEAGKARVIAFFDDAIADLVRRL